MKNLLTKENGIALLLSVVAFIGVTYALNKRDEKQLAELQTTKTSDTKSSADGGCGCGA